MEVSGQLHAPAALPRGKSLIIHWIRGGVGPEPVWALRRREKSLTPAGNRTQAVQPLIPPLYRLSYVPRLSMRGAIPPLRHVSSCRGA
jgi:hypothetical protein